MVAKPETKSEQEAAAEASAAEAGPETEAGPEADAEPEAVAASAAPEAVPMELQAQADGIIRRYMFWSAGAGLIPVVVLDAAALIAVQLRMLQQLSRLYGIPFQENAVKASVGALLGTATAQTVGFGTALLLLRVVPLVGAIATALSKPFFAAAFTYAVGRVFNQHFASGGTFLTFDPKKVESFFKEKFEEGKAEVRNATKAAA